MTIAPGSMIKHRMRNRVYPRVWLPSAVTWASETTLFVDAREYNDVLDIEQCTALCVGSGFTYRCKHPKDCDIAFENKQIIVGLLLEPNCIFFDVEEDWDVIE